MIIVPLDRLEGIPILFALDVLCADSSAREAWRAISA